MRKLLILVLLGLASLAVNGQTYGTGIGLRGGIFSGLTLKKNLGGSNYLEGI